MSEQEKQDLSDDQWAALEAQHADALCEELAQSHRAFDRGIITLRQYLQQARGACEAAIAGCPTRMSREEHAEAAQRAQEKAAERHAAPTEGCGAAQP